MALVKDEQFNAGTVSLGALPADTAFTAKRGHIGLTTDGGVGEDSYDLVAGERIILSSGLTVSAIKRGVGEALLHHMAV